MKLINIFPLGNIGCEYSQDMHMYLTHMVEKYPVYVEAARSAGGYKILDNSLIELGGAANIQRVLDAAGKIGADEIILPDIFQNGPATIEAVTDALKYIKEIYGDTCSYKLMAVAQGATEAEWLQCYETLINMPMVDVIGIPKVLAKLHPKGRAYFVNKYCKLLDKPHHLLGVWYSITEFRNYKYLDCIRSCDTVLISFMAKYGMDIEGVRPDGFTINLEKDVPDIHKMQKCIDTFKRRYAIT